MCVSMMGIAAVCAAPRCGTPATAVAATPARKSLRVTFVIRRAGYVRLDQLSTLSSVSLDRSSKNWRGSRTKAARTVKLDCKWLDKVLTLTRQWPYAARQIPFQVGPGHSPALP